MLFGYRIVLSVAQLTFQRKILSFLKLLKNKNDQEIEFYYTSYSSDLNLIETVHATKFFTQKKNFLKAERLSRRYIDKYECHFVSQLFILISFKRGSTFHRSSSKETMSPILFFSDLYVASYFINLENPRLATQFTANKEQVVCFYQKNHKTLNITNQVTQNLKLFKIKKYDALGKQTNKKIPVKLDENFKKGDLTELYYSMLNQNELNELRTNLISSYFEKIKKDQDRVSSIEKLHLLKAHEELTHLFSNEKPKSNSESILYLESLLYSGMIKDAHEIALKGIVSQPNNLELYDILLEIYSITSDKEKITKLLKIKNFAYPRLNPKKSSILPAINQFNFKLAGILNNYSILRNVYNSKWHIQHLLKFTKNHYSSQDIKTGKSLLVIASYGVADELYSSLHYYKLTTTFKEVTITCDPRLYDLLSSNHPDIKFIPTKRSFSLNEEKEDALSNIKSSYLLGSLEFDYINTFDFSMMTHEIFDFLNNHNSLKNTRLLQPTKASQSKTRNTLKVGVFWKSTKITPWRMKYFFDLNEIPEKLLSDKRITFYSLIQDEFLTNDESNFMQKHDIQKMNIFDTFNNFTNLQEYILDLDFVVGISGFNLDFAAALGISSYCLTLSRSSYIARCSEEDGNDSLFYTSSHIINFPTKIGYSSRPERVHYMFLEFYKEIFPAS